MSVGVVQERDVVQDQLLGDDFEGPRQLAALRRHRHVQFVVAAARHTVDSRFQNLKIKLSFI